MKQKIIGYHGTTTISAAIICERKRYFDSCDEEEWLGRGAYFFESDYQQAKNWCIKVKKYPNWAVLKSEIESDRILDLTYLENMDLFREYARRLKGRYLKRKDGSPRILINAVVIESLYALNKFDVIKAIFQVPKTEPVERTNIAPMQIQVCVRNHDCIISIDEVVT